MEPTTPKQDHTHRQYSVLSLLVATGVCACVMSATVVLNAPELPIAAAILVVAWMCRRIGGASMWSVVTWAIGAEMFVGAWGLEPDTLSWWPNFPQILCIFLGFLFCIISVILFTLNAVKSPARKTVGFVGMLLCAAFPFFWVIGAGPYLSRVRQAVQARQTARNKNTLATIVREVEVVHASLGRAARDEDELEALLGHPMPELHVSEIRWPIFYQRAGDDSFLLYYSLWPGDDWVYDSTAPNKGWTRRCY